MLKSKDILCPECGEPCKIKLKNFKIILYDCQNGHKNKIDFEKFEELQNIAKSKIKCNKCNNNNINNNKYFNKCIECNEYLCDICKKIIMKNIN